MIGEDPSHWVTGIFPDIARATTRTWACDHRGMTETRLRRWEHALDLPLTALALLFLAAYAWPILDPDLSRSAATACGWTVWSTWALLGLDYLARLRLAESRWDFVRANPIDLAAIALPVLRPLRLLRLVMLLSALNRFAGNSLRGRVATYLVGSVTLIVFVGGLAMLDAERGHGGPIDSFGDSLWWAMTTITTVGYGDMYPVTSTRRLIAMALMIAGIAVLGVVTASFASWLVERVTDAGEDVAQDTQSEIAQLTAEVRMLRQLVQDRS
jgi:voltage-gated potassium channel